MIIAVIAVGICQIVFFAGLCRLLTMYFERKQQAIEDRINDELVKLTTGKPCHTAALLLTVGQVLGSEAGRSAKAALMADLSHAQRQVNSQAEEQQLSLISDNNPPLGGVLQALGPRRRGSLLKNPLIQLAISAFSGQFGQGSAPGGNGSSGGSAAHDIHNRLNRS